MTKYECGDYTMELLKEYLPKEYTEWDVWFYSSKTIAAACYPGRKIIQISDFLLKHGTISQIQDVVLHEVAHAIAFTIDPYCTGHDETWKYVCYYIGCSGDLSIELNFNVYPDHTIRPGIRLDVIVGSVSGNEIRDVEPLYIPWANS